MDVELTIKHGSDTFGIALSATASVGELKQQLEQQTGTFVRNQKLIYKGKVLEDAATLEGCGICTGAKLMLLATEGLSAKVNNSARRPMLQLQNQRSKDDAQHDTAVLLILNQWSCLYVSAYVSWCVSTYYRVDCRLQGMQLSSVLQAHPPGARPAQQEPQVEAAFWQKR